MLAHIADRLCTALPPALRRDLGQARRSLNRQFPSRYRALRAAAEAVGAPGMADMDPALALALFRPGLLALGAADETEMSGAAAARAGVKATTPDSYRPVPYALWDTTALTASAVGQVADPASYLNGTGYPFVVTHVTFAQGSDPVRMNPNYRFQVRPAGVVPWMNERVDPNIVMDSMPFGAIPNTVAHQLSAWELGGGGYRMAMGQAMTVLTENVSSVESVRASVALIGQAFGEGTRPRVFWDQLSLGTSSGERPLQSAKFKNDGSEDILLHALVNGGGATTGWGTGVTLAPPRVLVRPDGDLDWMARRTSAVNLNTRPECIGGFWALRHPQTIKPGTSIVTQFDETTGAAVTAAVGYLGYLRVEARP